MRTNFTIKDGCALIHNGIDYDLHNNFDLATCEYKLDAKEFKISFIKSKGDWAEDVAISALALTHKMINHCLVEYKECKEFPDNEKCLSDLSFFPMEDRTTNDSIILQEVPFESGDILYLIQSGSIIRIGCEEIELTILQ